MKTTMLNTPSGRTPYDQYKAQEAGVARRTTRAGDEILFLLTFKQWLRIWERSGHAHERGSRFGQYVMSRYNDLGHYEVGNVFIQTAQANNSQANKNIKLSDEHKRKLSVAAKAARAKRNWSTASDGPDGRRKPMPEERKEKIRATLIARYLNKP